jgi:hypothetical protein
MKLSRLILLPLLVLSAACERHPLDPDTEPKKSAASESSEAPKAPETAPAKKEQKQGADPKFFEGNPPK